MAMTLIWIYFNCPKYPSNWVSDAFAAVLFVTLYSLIISNIFGHPSFWRLQHHIMNTEKIPPRSKSKQFLRIACKEKLFEFLNENVILEALYFLSAVDLLSISQLSRSHDRLIKQEQLWSNLSSNYFNADFKICAADVSSKVKFFSCLKMYPFQVAKSRNGVNVIICGRVYDLSKFIIEHPGGEGIISEWNGKDASKAFALALHSRYALRLADSYLVWPKRRENIDVTDNLKQ